MSLKFWKIITLWLVKDVIDVIDITDVKDANDVMDAINVMNITDFNDGCLNVLWSLEHHVCYQCTEHNHQGIY